MVFKWPVVPLCEAQMKDVREEDVLHGGMFRMCDTYRGGGGYDQFNKIYGQRTGVKVNPRQFVVQLKGCPLKCSYCYVTAPGIHGETVPTTTGLLIDIYDQQDVDVFHLMGGAPALYLEHWKRLAHAPKVFHSDFLLIEKLYEYEWVNRMPGLHAVSIKEFKYYNTEQLGLMLKNLQVLCEADISWYMTFTGPCNDMKEMLVEHFRHDILDDSFDIDIVQYKALETGDG